MCRVMTNELALLYNLNGRNGKEKFKETKLYSLLYREFFS